jgi:aryl-alcohol dehydrogenase-like predicted oxidoreductase
MHYRRLGSTDLTISRLILGCGNFGGVGSAQALFGMGESEAQAHELMDRAVDLGITVFDTANSYGGGRSETYIGRWLKAKGSRVRDHLILSSKVFNPVGPGPEDRGLSRGHILRQIDASLERLHTDRLDMYLTHAPDPDTPIEETLGALDEIVRAGKVRYIGASNIEPWRLAAALDVSRKRGLSRYDFVQNGYSLLDRTQEAEMFPLCAERRVGFTAFSPLAGGWLTGKYTAAGAYPLGSRMTLRPEPYRHLERSEVFAGLQLIAKEAQTRGVEMSALALAWILHQKELDAAVIGPRSPAHLDVAAMALDITLSDEDLGALSRPFPRPIHAGGS